MNQENLEVKESKIKTILVVEVGYREFEFDIPQQAFTFYMMAVNHKAKDYKGRVRDVDIYAKYVLEEHDKEENESEE